jgi:hypothetical protein
VYEQNCLNTQRENRLVFRIYFFICLCFVLTSCANQGVKTTRELKSNVQKKNFEAAEKIFVEDSYYLNPKNIQLRSLDLAGLLHLKGDYEGSSLELQKVIKQFDDFYTASVTQKVNSFVLNDYFQNYRGRWHEVVLAHYLQSLNFYLLARASMQDNKNDQVVKKLEQARSVLINLENIFKQAEREYNIRLVQQYRILQAFWASFIHYEYGRASKKRNEMLTAYYLSKRGVELFFRYYPELSFFNGNAEAFSNCSVSGKAWMGCLKDVKWTPEGMKLLRSLVEWNSFLAHTSKAEGQLEKAMIAQVPELKDIEKMKAKSVSLLLEHTGLGPNLIAKEVGFSLSDSSLSVNALDIVMGDFAADVLGMRASGTAVSGTNDILGTATGTLLYKTAGISFELPTIDPKAVVQSSSDKTLLFSGSTFLGDALKEEAKTLYPKVGVRLASKYLTAIGASYLSYTAMKAKGNESAKMLAYLQFIGSDFAIKASEKADLRSWTLMPQNIAILFKFYESEKVPGENFQYSWEKFE